MTGSRRLGAGSLVLPALAFLALCYALPLAALILDSLRSGAGVSLAEYHALLTDAYIWKAIGRTLWVAFAVTAVCVVFGYPVAMLMSRLSGGWVNAFHALIVLSMALSVIVKAFAWQVLLRGNGPVNQLLQWLGLVDAPLRLLLTPTGLIAGAANIFLPFMILPIYSAARQLPAEVFNAAATLGAGPVYRFFHVTLPLTAQGLFAGITVVLSLAVSMYVIPNLLVGDQFQTLATLTGKTFLGVRNEKQGAALAAILLALSVGIVLLGGFVSQRLGKQHERA